MARQFYKMITRPLPETAQGLMIDLAPYNQLHAGNTPPPPGVVGTYPVNEHTLLYIHQDYSMVLACLVIPEGPISPVPQDEVASVMMVNPPFTINLNHKYYQGTDESTFSTTGEFAGEPARFIIGPNEQLIFEFYRQLNSGMVHPSPRGFHRRINLDPPDEV